VAGPLASMKAMFPSLPRDILEFTLAQHAGTFRPPSLPPSHPPSLPPCLPLTTPTNYLNSFLPSLTSTLPSLPPSLPPSLLSLRQCRRGRLRFGGWLPSPRLLLFQRICSR
jgi:hypothetical protein